MSKRKRSTEDRHDIGEEEFIIRDNPLLEYILKPGMKKVKNIDQRKEKTFVCVKNVRFDLVYIQRYNVTEKKKRFWY